MLMQVFQWSDTQIPNLSNFDTFQIKVKNSHFFLMNIGDASDEFSLCGFQVALYIVLYRTTALRRTVVYYCVKHPCDHNGDGIYMLLSGERKQRDSLSPVFTIQPVVNWLSNGWTTGWTNSGCSLFTRISRLSNRLYNRFDNRLYRVNGVLELCSTTSEQNVYPPA